MRVLAEDFRTARIPVVPLSADAIPADIARGLHAGVFRYLTKPIRIDEFMETIDLALKHAKAQSILSDKAGGA